MHKNVVVAGAVLVVVILTSFLVGFSFRVVNFDEYALLYNINSREITEGVFVAGRHYVGLSSEFHRFSKRHTNVEFSLAAENGDSSRGPFSIRATDGQQIELELSFQYKVKKDSLHLLYRDFKFDYETFLVRQARGTLRDVASQYTAVAFFDSRDAIEGHMRSALATELAARHTELVGFQLREIDLPEALDQNLLAIQLEKQEGLRLEAETSAWVTRNVTANEVLKLETASSVLLSKLEQETENLRVAVARNVSRIQQTTNREVLKIRTAAATGLALYRQDTENLRLGIVSNTTLAVEGTQQLLAQIRLHTAVLAAQKDATLSNLRAEASANVTRILASAQAQAAESMEKAKTSEFAILVQALGITPDQAIHSKWVDAMAAHDSSRLFMDLTTPASLKVTN